jgi:hypothetical protein
MSLKYSFKGIMSHNRDGSFSTQRERSSTLLLVASQLKEGGFRQMKPSSLKTKHINTIKNRMAHLRWLAQKIGKPQIVPATNAELGIEQRCNVTNTDKSTELRSEHLEKISDVRVQDALKLQATFGLRREEALKFIPAYALQTYKETGCIQLKASWCKGGRTRLIPVRSQEQLQLLYTLDERYGAASLIPPQMKYVQMKDRYKNTIQRIGLGKGHGLRHRYVQIIYQSLTGFPCRVKGGPSYKDMTPEQKLKDREARQIISWEVGHNRIEVVAQYIGS